MNDDTKFAIFIAALSCLLLTTLALLAGTSLGHREQAGWDARKYCAEMVFGRDTLAVIRRFPECANALYKERP